MSESLQQVGFGEPRPVAVGDLEAELSALWRSTAEDPKTEHPVTRSCALTLVVYVESEEAGREVLDLLPSVTAQNPCRAVVMAAAEGTPSGLWAKISAQCRLPAPGEKAVCCEQVMVLARGEAARGLDRVVIPLIVPGLPVYFWWRAGGFSRPSIRNLSHCWDRVLRSADCVLIDSSRFENPELDLVDSFDEVRRLSNEVVVTDLNWSRLTPWREIIAQSFDPPEMRPYLDQLSEIQIEFEQDSPRVLAHRAQSLLLAGWLANQLKWTPVLDAESGDTAPAAFLFRSGHGSVRVERVARRFEGGGAGRCMSVTLKTGGKPPAAFLFSRGPDGKTVQTRAEVSGRPAVERAVLLEVSDEAGLVKDEMQFAGRDRVYEGSLGMIRRMLGRQVSTG